MSNLDRITFPCEFKFSEEGAGTVEGYASVFNLLDRGGDIVMPGAFKASLASWRKRKSAVPMLWQHDPYAPIGIWNEFVEDGKGLKVKGEFTPEDSDAAAAHRRVKHGSVKGLSIGYRTIDYDIDRTTGARHLKKVDLWEVSLVTFAMLPEALITGVKMDFDAPSWERALRDAGLSRADAKLATSIARKMVQRDVGRTEPAPREAAADVLMGLRKAVELMRA